MIVETISAARELNVWVPDLEVLRSLSPSFTPPDRSVLESEASSAVFIHLFQRKKLLLGSPAGVLSTRLTKDRLMREKHTDLFNISFT